MYSILISGKNGQVGRALCAAAWPDEYKIIGLDRESLDVGSRDSVRGAMTTSRPDLIINTAAFTAVDAAEDQADDAYAVNDAGLGHLAAAAADIGCPVIHFSTDYVFDGTQKDEYREDDATNPLGVYGASKLAGEVRLRSALQHHLIIRTSGVFDDVGANFVRAILNAGASRSELNVVDDQTCGPTWSVDIANAVVRISQTLVEKTVNDPWGTYHFCSRPSLSWYQFAGEIFEIAATHGATQPVLRPIPGADYPAKAKRPGNPALCCARIGQKFGLVMPDRTNAVRAVIRRILEQPARAE